MENKKRITKLLLILLVVCLVIAVLGYFFYTFLHTNDRGIAEGKFAGKLFASEDVNIILEFSDDVSSAQLRLNGATGTVQQLNITYEENLFTGTTETETYYFLVLGENSLYSSTGNYLYTAQYSK